MFYNGTVVISPTASGSLFLDSSALLNGTLSARDNPALENFTCHMNPRLDDDRENHLFPPNSLRLNFTLHNLSSLVSFSVSHPFTRALVADSLPSLKSFEIWGPEGTHYQPVFRNVTLVDLPKLREMTYEEDTIGAPVSEALVIRNAGLDRIDPFFVARETEREFTAEVSGIPNVHHFNYSLQSRGAVSIAGNSNLSFQIVRSPCYSEHDVHTGNLTLSGLSSFSVLRPINKSEPENQMAGYGVYIDTLRVHDNENLVTLPLNIDRMQNLAIVKNPRLATMLSVWHSSYWAWDEMVISGNPLLRFNSSVVVTDEFAAAKRQNRSWPLTTDFYWPRYNVNTIVLEGHFDNAFL